MSQSGKLTPNLDQQSTKLLNLTVLQRIDPFIGEILVTAAHVTFYEFNIEQNQWSRKDVEGSLFVVKRNAQPRFQFIVMNRRNTENLVENLLGDFEFEVQTPYLLYRNASQEVIGIWFYNANECEEVGNLFSRLLSAYSKVPAKVKASSTKSEFEEIEAVPSMPVVDSQREQSPTTSPAKGGAEDSSLMGFFNAAMNISNGASNVASSRQFHPSSAAIPPSSHVPNLFPNPSPTIQMPQLSLPASSSSLTLQENTEFMGPSNNVTTLVKPSSFHHASSSPGLVMPPTSTCVPSLNSSANLHGPNGSPLLQPFPPPTPTMSLSSGSSLSPGFGAFLSQDKVRDALLMLVQVCS
ncbi:mRNA-decapping enzyme subunit 1 [Dillenia turbinata]|uniref:mRNA-decapping enzyme subunit 1 n=1 Tax=Dillenia turbinata TaxID=194707 RepID=A0AAN8ZIK1_9MAGN